MCDADDALMHLSPPGITDLPLDKRRNGMAGLLHWTGIGETMPNHPPISELCYLDAANVNSPAGVLSELHVVTANGEQLGSIAGVVIEAAAGRARYLNIRSAGWLSRRHYLVEADQLAQVDPERKVLRLLSDDVTEVPDLGTAVLRPFSDEDLLAAMFPSRAA
jgi:hypothetical protein